MHGISVINHDVTRARNRRIRRLEEIRRTRGGVLKVRGAHVSRIVDSSHAPYRKLEPRQVERVDHPPPCYQSPSLASKVTWGVSRRTVPSFIRRSRKGWTSFGSWTVTRSTPGRTRWCWTRRCFFDRLRYFGLFFLEEGISQWESLHLESGKVFTLFFRLTLPLTRNHCNFVSKKRLDR